MPWLEYLTDEGAQECQIDLDRVSIGREEECTVRLPDDGRVSRVHCSLNKQDDGSYALTDEGSKNGTLVNGEPVVTAAIPLADGDRIKVGDTTLVFHQQVRGKTTMLFGEVADEMEKGKGFHTLMGEIVVDAKKKDGQK